MEQTEIVRVREPGQMRRFIDLPYSLYRSDPHWVAPLRVAVKQLLNTSRHPFYAHADLQCFLALHNGRVVGRVAAIVDHNYNRFHDEQAGFFGFFESTDDQNVARALLDAARDWLMERGARTVRGPLNPSTNYECGLLVEGFDSDPVVMMTYNPPYYALLIESAGFRKAKDLLAYHSTTAAANDARPARVADRAISSNPLRIRPIHMREFHKEVERVFEVYNSAWERNWGFAPMTREEFFLMAKDLKQLIVPDLVLIGEVHGKVVGFALAVPDINLALKHAQGRLFPFGLLKILYYQRLIRNLRVIALGVVPEHQTAGVTAGFYITLIRNGRRLGYRNCEMSWVLEDNVMMNRSLEALGARRYKTYRIYERN